MKKTIDVYQCDNASLVQKEKQVDATAEKLLERLKEIEALLWRLRSEKDAINTALAVAGVRITGESGAKHSVSYLESDYTAKKPFAAMSLTDACLKTLVDYSKEYDEWLSKTQVEYLVTRGGYKFTAASNTKNSVAVTLQRLADEGRIQVERVRGSAGNKYQYDARKDSKSQNPQRGPALIGEDIMK